MPQHSPAFFASPSNQITQDVMQLHFLRTNKVTFDAKKTEHTQFIINCTNRAQQQLKTLQSIDLKATVAFSLGTFALTLSYILPLSLIAGACFAYGAYQLGQRSDVYKNYTQTLETLAGCCDWSLGKNDNREILKNESIVGMLSVLNAHVTKDDLRALIHDKIEDEAISKVEENTPSFLEHHIEKDQSAIYFKMYGYKQGSFLDVLQGIQFAITTAFLKLRAPSQDEQPQQALVSTMS